MADFAYRGVWPIVPTALTADEQVDEAGMRRILEYVIGGGVDGCSCWALEARVPISRRRSTDV